MKTRDLIDLLGALDVRPSRKLGQNFLVDANVLRCIVEAAAPAPGERILEVGAGTGVLTRELLAADTAVLAIEYDARLAAYLRETMADVPRLTLVEGDACRLDLAALVGDGPYACVANLPYSVSSVVLARLLELRNRPSRCCVLLQAEMAERLAARPGSKSYGGLTVRLQAAYDVAIVRMVSPTVFYPPPEVSSAVVRMALRPDAIAVADYPGFGKLVQAAFSQRRKMMAKLLKGSYGAEATAAAMATVGIPAAARAEAVTVAQFRALYRALATT